MDVLIEGTISIEPDLSNKMHSHGGKVVCYKMGPDYIMDIEKFIFNQPAGRVFNGSKFDSIWLIPQNENTCRSYFSIMFECDAHVVPAIWAPTFCDIVIKNLKEKHGIEFGYKPNKDRQKWRNC